MTETRAIRIRATGGPEVMGIETLTLSPPGPGEALVRHTAIGLNFIDTYYRSGLYAAAALPTGLGLEGAGVVEAVGAGVTEVRPGQRVAYVGGPLGSYAERRVIPAWLLVALPDAIDDRTGAAMMMQGLTSYYLLYLTHALEAGEIILVHAAAGGVGLMLCQWAKHLGATVIGTVGSDAKAELARAHGCDHAIVYTREDFATRVREITNGRGVRVVYDSVGAATFAGSLDCLARRGLMVSYGNASGPVTGIDLGVLAAKGSLFLTRPTLFHHIDTPVALARAAGALIDAVVRGIVRIEVRQTYALDDAVTAHRDLEARKTMGSSVILP